MNKTSPLIALCAGEASGDLLGAHLMEAIRARCPNARFTGIGGPRMTAIGFESLYEQEKLAVRGFAEVVKRLPEILSIRKGLIEKIRAARPDVFVGIDAPDFNLHVEEKLKQTGIPTVGHPMAQTIPLEADRAAARQRMKLDGDTPVFALLPGSRVSEIDYMAPIFFQTAKLILQRYPAARFLLPVATHATRNRLTALLAEERFKHLPIQLMTAHADLACTAADAVLVTSGTATLEVALCKRPMVISYKISPLTYAYVKRKIKVPHVGLPNILLGREAVPELLQSRAKPQLLADALIKWYESPEDCAALQRDFHELHHMLRRDTAELAAQNVLEEAGAL